MISSDYSSIHKELENTYKTVKTVYIKERMKSWLCVGHRRVFSSKLSYCFVVINKEQIDGREYKTKEKAMNTQ